MGRTRSARRGRGENRENKCDAPQPSGHPELIKMCGRKTGAAAADAEVKPRWCLEERVRAEKSIRKKHNVAFLFKKVK